MNLPVKKMMALLLAGVVALGAAPVFGADNVFALPEFSLETVYQDNFDGKTKDEIYSHWKGMHSMVGYDQPVHDGKLLATWLTDQSVGYVFNTELTKAKYEFDICVAPTEDSFSSAIVLRSAEHGGGYFNPRDDLHNGVGLYIYNNEINKMLLYICSASGEAKVPCFELDYPDGVDFRKDTRVTIYDMDDKILYYINQKPFAAICFDGLSGDMYTRGTVYDKNGKEVGTFGGKQITRGSNFAVAERVTDTYMDNITISQMVDEATLAQRAKEEKEKFEATETITMYVGSSRIVYKKGSTIDKVADLDGAPMVYNNMLLVPLRGILELCGATVEWFGETQDIKVSKDDMVISMRIAEDRYYVYSDKYPKGQRFNFDVKPQIVNGRTMVPVRLFSEQLGFNVDWNENTQKIILTTSFEDPSYNETEFIMK